MLKYIKDQIENTATKYFVIKEVQNNRTVAYNKPESCLIRPGNTEISRYTQRNPKVYQAKSQLQLYSEKWRSATERVLAYMRQICGICNLDNLNNLTDLRTSEDFQRMINSVDNSKPNNEQTHEYIKENEHEMQKMIYRLKRQRDWSRLKAEFSPNKPVDESHKEPNQQVEGNVTKRLRDMLRSGELLFIVAGKNEEYAEEDNKEGLLNIDDVLEYEEAKRKWETARIVHYRGSQCIITGVNRGSLRGTAYHIKAEQREYLRNFIEHNRMMDRIMMNLRNPRKSDETEKVRTNPSVKTDNKNKSH